MLPSMTAVKTEDSMEQRVRCLEVIQRALRAAPQNSGGDPRITEAVADCLRDLRAIAAQAADDDNPARPHLRLIECVAPLAASENPGRGFSPVRQASRKSLGTPWKRARRPDEERR